MTSISIEIVRYVEDHFPGYVECLLTDALGEVHKFIEKVPVVTFANLTANSGYPQSGWLECIIEDEWTDEVGNKLVRANTERSSGIESTAGESVFVVQVDQVIFE
jgi:hypothetical protein